VYRRRCSGIVAERASRKKGLHFNCLLLSNRDFSCNFEFCIIIVKFLGKRVEIEREKLLTLIDSCIFLEKVDLHKRET